MKEAGGDRLAMIEMGGFLAEVIHGIILCNLDRVDPDWAGDQLGIWLA